MASCSRVRDGTQVFRTQEGVWAVAEVEASHTGPRLLPRGCTGVGLKLMFSFPTVRDWGQLR